MENLDTTTDKGPNNHRDVEVFGSVFCPYTRQATRLLEEKGFSDQYREVPMVLGWKLPLKIYLVMKRRLRKRLFGKPLSAVGIMATRNASSPTKRIGHWETIAFCSDLETSLWVFDHGARSNSDACSRT